MFVVGNTYSKWDIYKILSVPKERQRGAWDKGYTTYEGKIFIFSNVGIPGRTGHDYKNYWDGDLFNWEASNNSHLRQPQIQRMINPGKGEKVFLFTRTDDRDPWTFEGNVKSKEVFDTKPVKVIWEFENYPYETLEEPTIVSEDEMLYEGAVSKVTVNKYERNPLARRICIEHFGAFCNVCDFDFYITYGDIGKGYIHVHHIIPISALGKEYQLVPEKDLIPVCPNCHSIIHKRKPIFGIEEIKELIAKQHKREGENGYS
jgi:5-methylcytosine-specific restriction enzyme A